MSQRTLSLDQLRRQNTRLKRQVQRLTEHLACIEGHKAAVIAALEGIPSSVTFWFDEDDTDETELMMKLRSEIDDALALWREVLTSSR